MVEFKRPSEFSVKEYLTAIEHAREDSARARERFTAAQERGDLKVAQESLEELSINLRNLTEFRRQCPRGIIHSAHAEKILGSFQVTGVNTDDYFATLTIPGFVSDIDAMQALNAALRSKYGSLAEPKTAITESAMDWLVMFGGVGDRKLGEPRVIALHPLVYDAEGKTRSEQESILREKGLCFSSPIDQAFVEAAFLCSAVRTKHGYSSLFQNLRGVRGSVESHYVSTRSEGIDLIRDLLHDEDIGVSGTPISPKS